MKNNLWVVIGLTIVVAVISSIATITLMQTNGVSLSPGENGTNLLAGYGNVGIGTTNPPSPLSVYNTNGDTSPGQTYGQYGLLIRNSNNGVNTIAGIGFHTDSSNQGSGEIGFQNKGSGINGISDFFITTRGSSGWGERLRIVGNGNVGIGTTNPQAKLDVNGDIRASVVYTDTINSKTIFSNSSLLLSARDNNRTVNIEGFNVYIMGLQGPKGYVCVEAYTGKIFRSSVPCV